MPEPHREGPSSRTSAVAMADACARLLESLDDEQRTIAWWPFPSDEERRLWFYTPTDHGGLPLSGMDAPQQRLAFELMSAGLSTAGYVTAATIIGLENVLDMVEGFSVSWDRPRGRDPLLYYVRVFGPPDQKGTWAWRVGGHHVSINVTVVDGKVAGSTPLFLGADPASAPLLGPHPLRPLAGVEDLARELTRSLDPDQRARAVVSPRAPADLVGANRPSLGDDEDAPAARRDIWRGDPPRRYADPALNVPATRDEATRLTAADVAALSLGSTPKGLAAADMRRDQREMLDTLLRRYTHRLPDDLAAAEDEKFAGARLDAVHLLWAGGLESGEPHYYRLHSPVLLAEYDNTANGANHVHSVWRDPRGDFADDVLARHRASHPH